MSALDPYAQPIDQTAQVGVDEANQAADDMDAQRKARNLQLQAQQNAANRQQSLETAGGDAAQWALDPHYMGKSWAEQPDEVHQHFQTAYPEIQSEIPGIVNKAAAEVASPIRPTKYQHVTNPQTGEMGAFDPVTGEYKSTPTQQPSDPNAFTNPANQNAMIQGFLNGQLGSSALPRGGPMKAAIINKILAQDPKWTPQDADARAKARESFAGNGVNAKNIVSLNTMLEHLGQVDDTVGGLNNGTTPMLNRGENFLAQQFGTQGNKAIQKFKTASETAATEYARALTGGVPSVAQIKEAQAMLDPAQDPAVLKSNIQEMAKMAGGRLGALQNEWTNTVKGKRDIPFITGNSPARLRQFGIDPASIEGASGAQPAVSSASKPAFVRQGGVVYQLQPDGSYK